MGTFVFRNWNAHASGSPELACFEYPLYSDSQVIGEVLHDFGPYRILNAINRDSTSPSLILRVSVHAEPSPPKKPDGKNESYHGGTEEDEIAALLSLSMGIRLKAGDYTREFRPGRDPKGRPHYLNLKPTPTLLPPTTHALLLPRVMGKHNVADASATLSGVVDASESDVFALTRAARQYQEAMWLVEAEPQLAWLLFVTAVETIAQHSHVESSADDEHVRQSSIFGDLYRTVLTECSTEVAHDFVEVVGKYTRATKKFVEFGLRYRPRTLSHEAPESQRFNFENDDAVEQALRRVYDYRSRALHDGKPFPLPMCDPGMAGGASEVPIAGLVARGGYWPVEEIPILLPGFERIVRESILNWWNH